MPEYSQGANAIPLFDHLPPQEKESVLGSREFEQYKQDIWKCHHFQNASEIVSGLQDVDDFHEAYAQLTYGEPDYLAACRSDPAICLVSGNNGAFYFRWDDPSTIESNAANECMIDYRAFAADNEIPLDEYALTAGNQLTAHKGADTLADYFKLPAADRLSIHELFEEIATAQVNEYTAIANRLEQERDYESLAGVKQKLSSCQETLEMLLDSCIEDIYGAYINLDYVPLKTAFVTPEEAAKAACSEFQIDANAYRQRFDDHRAIDAKLAHALRSQGEKIVEVLGLNIWCRQTTGTHPTMEHNVQQALIHGFPTEMNNVITSVLPMAAQRIEKMLEAQKAQQSLNTPPAP